MKSDLLAPLAKSPLLLLPIFALFLFIAIFLVATALAMRKRNDPAALLPLEDDEGREEGR